MRTLCVVLITCVFGVGSVARSQGDPEEMLPGVYGYDLSTGEEL